MATAVRRIVPSAPAVPRPAPVVWALLGAHRGDNDQVLELARETAGTVIIKRLRFNALFPAPNALLGASVATLDSRSRASLAPPWPDLVIGAGRRTVAPSVWIREQSGGRTRIVRIGRPRAALDRFELIITTPQYSLPSRGNVIHLPLPFVSGNALNDAELESWRGRLAPLPRPWIGVLVGGSSWPYVLGPREARHLARSLNTYFRREGGAPIIITSPRTGSRATRALENALEVPHFFHPWRAGGVNPYAAVLNLADQFIVTADSVSMLAQACRKQRPVALFNLPRRSDPVSWVGQYLSAHACAGTLLGAALRRLTELGLFSPPRMISRVHEVLFRRMPIFHFDANRRIHEPAIWSADDHQYRAAVARVRSLAQDGTEGDRDHLAPVEH